MDFTARKRVTLKSAPDIDAIYSHDLNMYKLLPTGETNLEEFETLAIERLQLFRVLEQASAKGNKLFSEDWRKCVKEDLTKLELKKFVRLIDGCSGQKELDINARKADHLSHFILRLAYCRSEDLRRWFINRELEWFRLKFLAQNQDKINKFLEYNDLIYVPISDEEKDELFNELVMSTASMSDINVKTSNFFKVPFDEVCSLVKSRRVFVKLGYAYIPTNDLVVCVQAKFRANLSEALNIASHRLPYLDDDRISSFLMNLNDCYTGKDYNSMNSDQGIDPSDLEMYSKKHYPMCMRHVHQQLRSAHHLKHECRLQYGLFLKAMGLSFENAMEFWREEFTKKMDDEKFKKNYSYNVKHLYGKVGSRIDYTAYSCMKIIMQSVGPGEHHGCPFKHWDPSLVKQRMLDYGVSNDDSESIIDIVKRGHYQIACTKYFECTHSKQPPLATINHPNQFFEESMNVNKKKNT